MKISKLDMELHLKKKKKSLKKKYPDKFIFEKFDLYDNYIWLERLEKWLKLTIRGILCIIIYWMSITRQSSKAKPITAMRNFWKSLKRHINPAVNQSVENMTSLIEDATF